MCGPSGGINGPTKGFWGVYGLEVPSSRTVHPYSVHGELVKGWGFIVPCELSWWGRSGPEAPGTVVLGDGWLLLSWGNLAWQGPGMCLVGPLPQCKGTLVCWVLVL